MSELDFIKKANVSLDTIAPGGRLLPEQVQEIIERMIIESKLLQIFQTITMERPRWEQPRMGFLGQVLHPDTEFVSMPEEDRAEPNVDKSVLEVKRLKAVGRIGYHTLEEVVGGDRFQPFLIQLLAKAAKRDLEMLLLNGDTSLPASGATPQIAKRNRLLRLMDGIIKKSSSYIYNAGGQPLNATVLDQMELLMPDQYGDDENHVILTSKKAAIRYRTTVAQRGTPAGDSQLARREFANHHGTPILYSPLIPSNLGANQNESIALRMNPKNVLVGILTDMMVEMKREPNPGYVEVVMRWSVDTTLEEPDATVQAQRILAAAA